MTGGPPLLDPKERRAKMCDFLDPFCDYFWSTVLSGKRVWDSFYFRVNLPIKREVPFQRESPEPISWIFCARWVDGTWAGWLDGNHMIMKRAKK